jgi:antitoxin ParD1/3/4
MARVSEVVRDALCDWWLHRKVEAIEIEQLCRPVREGIDSRPGLDAEGVFARVRFGRPPDA